MDIIELKRQITDQTLDDSFKVFVCPENYFLADQYIEAICNINGCNINKINSIYEPTSSALSLVLNFNSSLNILKVDEFAEVASDYSKFKNIIVVCQKIDKKLKTTLTDYIIEFPKLEDWQVESYMAVLCPGINKEEIHWLYNACQGDIYRILNELEKISIFPKTEQHDILTKLIYDKNSDLYNQTIFEVADAIVKNDKQTLLNFIRHEKNFTFDPIAISNIIFGTLKKIILIKFNSGATANEIGVSPKQYIAFKNYLYNNYTPDKAFKAMEFISGIDLKLKSSEFLIEKENILDYIICKMAV